MKQVIVTGGAGFIGSCIVRMLNDMGVADIIIVDHIASTDKWMNLCNKSYTEYIGRDELPGRLPELEGGVSHIIHMGACSATTERDFDFLYKNNFAYTKALWQFCAQQEISFIYASSAATYGDGANGFDDKSDITKLRPLNGYGYSKQLFDLWAQRQLAERRAVPRQQVGFKFFNVYGPNEYFKGSMASVTLHTFEQIEASGKMELFKSCREDFPDGGQLRDFVYVKDICKVVRYVLEHESVNGLFNLGTGIARSFYDLAASTFDAMGLAPQVESVEMPRQLRDKYQYYTRASMEKLRENGYRDAFYSLEDGIRDYVQNYLMHGKAIY